MNLPAPAGAFGVGTVTCALEDPDRPAHVASTRRGRRLFLKLWYPAIATTKRELLWSELRATGRAPWAIRLLLAGLRQRTASVSHAPLAVASLDRVVLYNHGLVSFAAENTSMAEDLASRGVLVIAIEHVEQLAEYRGLTRDAAATDRIDRIVQARAADTAFVLDRLDAVLASVPEWPAGRSWRSRVHLAGFSLGGAVSAEVAARDARIAGVINLDGGTQGSGSTREVRVPYLMLYSAGNDGCNDEDLPPQARRAVAPGTRHLNYHDVAGVLPLLRWSGALGSAPSTAVLQWRNELVAAFVAEHA